MKRAWVSLVVLLCTLLSPVAFAAEPVDLDRIVQDREQRLQWWRDAKFGLFIHWGPASVNGTEISWSRIGHPFDHHGMETVPSDVYDNLYKRFDPVKFDADAWMRMARDAGMKYVVFITKHHDGFSMWPTKLRDYNISHTPFKRDICREIADAAHKYGLKLGWYYSTRDWTHPDYLKGDNSRYNDFYEGQIRELLSNYGRVDVMWFDHVAGNWRDYRFRELFQMMYRLQPGLVVNNRAARFIRATDDQPAPGLASIVEGDFDTPEQQIGKFQVGRAWESCVTMTQCADGGGWSYRPDGRTRSYEECLRMLIECVTGDGNLLLNVGPLPTGEIDPHQVAALKQIGQWLGRYGQSVYGTRGGPWRNGEWGGSTHRPGAVYVHVLKWTGDAIELPPLKNRIISATCITGGDIAMKQTDDALTLSLPAGSRDPVDTVIKLAIEGDPVLAPAGIRRGADGSIRLPVSVAQIIGKTARLEGAGQPNLGFWTDPADFVQWRLRIDKPGAYDVQVEMGCDGPTSGSTFAVTIGDQSVTGTVQDTGGWQSYRMVTVGTVTIAKADDVQVIVKPIRVKEHAVMNLRSVKLLPAQARPRIRLDSPLDYQVFQRQTRTQGRLTLNGTVDPSITKLELHLSGQPLEGALPEHWQPISIDGARQSFHAVLPVPAGGWYTLQLRGTDTAGKSAIVSVDHVGVGEVFVGAGQSNSTNYGQSRQKTTTRRVSTFDGQTWRLADDPQPGAQDGSNQGSFWPAFGDALVDKYDVPVGVAVTGAGATSVRQWLPRGHTFTIPPTTGAFVKKLPDGRWECDGRLFDGMMRRIEELGPHGFRALLWHQGESDANQPPGHTLPGAEYRADMETIIRASWQRAGWKFPWFVALATYHTPDDTGSPDIRAAQKSLWDSGLALQGPDTDTLRGPDRNEDGRGVHLSPQGLQKHGRMWAEKVVQQVQLDK